MAHKKRIWLGNSKVIQLPHIYLNPASCSWESHRLFALYTWEISNSSIFWNSMIDKEAWWMERWSIILIQSILSSMHIYFSSLFRISVKLEKVTNFWSGTFVGWLLSEDGETNTQGRLVQDSSIQIVGRWFCHFPLHHNA